MTNQYNGMREASEGHRRLMRNGEMEGERDFEQCSNYFSALFEVTPKPWVLKLWMTWLLEATYIFRIWLGTLDGDPK